MSNPPATPSAGAPSAQPDAHGRHLTEPERAMRASLAGLALGVFLRLVSRRRSA